jgi:Domain of unknown function (DUF4190)
MTDPADSAGHAQPAAEPPLDFDPYRFGRPEQPVPPEYAPPGYVWTPPQQAPAPQGSAPWAPQQVAAQQVAAQQAPPQAGYTPLPPYAQPGGWTSGPPAYQYPPPPYMTGPVTNGRATAALVLGIASIVLCWLTVIDVPAAVLAIVFGVLGRRQAQRTPGAVGRGPATAGLICGIIGAVLAVTIFAIVLSNYSDCLSVGSNRMQQCIENH